MSCSPSSTDLEMADELVELLGVGRELVRGCGDLLGGGGGFLGGRGDLFGGR